MKLEPKNPRVRLVEALALFDRAGKDAAAKRRAALAEAARRDHDVRGRARRRVDARRSGAPPRPTPSSAARLFDQRDVVGAREALERALLIAPDYAFARRLMSQITR